MENKKIERIIFIDDSGLPAALVKIMVKNLLLMAGRECSLKVIKLANILSYPLQNGQTILVGPHISLADRNLKQALPQRTRLEKFTPTNFAI
ncbi:hypothetical protein [Enterococcus sp. LJL90]